MVELSEQQRRWTQAWLLCLFTAGLVVTLVLGPIVAVKLWALGYPAVALLVWLPALIAVFGASCECWRGAERLRRPRGGG